MVFTPDESEEEPFNMAIDDTSDDPTIVMGKAATTTFVSNDVHIPTEKVGCLQVTSQLQDFLNHFPPESKEKAFQQIYQILQVLDAYLIDNPQQHQLRSVEIDLCNFLAIWAVLSILKSNELQYVKNLQQVVNDCYEKCPMEDMSRLEQQTTEILDVMYDSMTNQNFDRVSDDVDSISGAVDNDSCKHPFLIMQTAFLLQTAFSCFYAGCSLPCLLVFSFLRVRSLRLFLGNVCERMCVSRSLLGSYVHQESI